MPQRLKFRNKDTGDTFEFDWDKSEKPTPDELRDIYKQQHPDPPGMMQSAWDFVNKPISDAWGATNKPIIPIIDQPLKGVPHSPTMRQMSEENYAADPTLANRAIKFGGQTASDALSWTSSPMALGMGVVGAGTGAAAAAGRTGLARAGKLALGAASTAFTGSGGKHMYEAKTPEEFLGGAMEAGGGLLGLAHGAMNWRTPPPEVPTKNGGIVPFEGNVEAYKQAYTHGPDPEPPLAPASERGFTELPGRREPPPFTSEAPDDTGGYMSGRYGIKPRDWAASDPTLATVPDRLRPPAPNERMFDQMLPAVMRERAMGQVEPIRGGPTFGGGVVTPPEMGGPPQPPPRPRPQPRPRPPVAPPIQEPPIIQPPMQAAVPDMEPLDLGRMPVTGMTPDIEAGPPPLNGQMPEPTPNRMNLGEPRFRGPKQEPQTMPKKAPPVTETVPGEAPGYDADRPYARIDEPNVRALAEAGDMDAIRELHTRGVLEAPKERPGIVRRILGNEAGSAGEQPPERSVSERARRILEEERLAREAAAQETERKGQTEEPNYELDNGPAEREFRRRQVETGSNLSPVAQAGGRTEASIPPPLGSDDFYTDMERSTNLRQAPAVPLPDVEPAIPERIPGRRAGVRDLTPIRPDESHHEMFPVAPEGKLKFGEPLEWKSLPPLAERVHEGEPSQGKLMDVPKFERPEDTIQPVGATEEKQPPIVPRVLSAENDGYGGLTVKFHDRITKQRVQDLFPDARFVYTTERADVNGRGATYHVSFSGETSAARKAAANTAHAAIKEHLYESPGKQESFTKDLKSQETWDKLPKLTPEQGRGAVESLDPENAMTSLGREYAHQTLASAREVHGIGEPGVEHKGHGDYHTLIYRNSKGQVDSVASIGPDADTGKRGIYSLAADETKGMAFGRPLMKFLPKLQELDAMRVNGGFSPYTENLIRKALSRYSNERGSTTIPTEIASAILKLFKDEKGEVRLPPDLSETLNKAAIGTSKGIKAVGRELASFGVNARNIKSGVDISAPRQAALMIGRKEFWKNTPKLVKAFMNPEVAKEVRTSIALRDSYPRMKKAGVFFADIGKTAGQKGEEGFQGDWAKKLPLIGRSEAAFDAFLSSIRADAFERFAKLSDDMGKNHPAEYRTEEVDGKSKQVKVKDSTDVQIAKLVGNLTGRGDLGKLEPAAKALSAAFFSPRLLASRVQTLRYLLDPTTYEHTDPMVRKEAIKSMLHLATANVLFLGALKTAGQLTGRKDISVELDPISSDFMKGKIGNTRFDAGEGFQQIVRTFAQIASGKQKSPITGRVSKLGSAPTVDTRLDKAVGFARSKLAPVPGVAADWMAGKTIGGESFDWGKAGLGFITPLIVSDINDVLQDNPGFKIDLPYFGETTVAPKLESIPKLAATAAAASVGVGTQTFGATAPRSGRRRARPLRESRQ